MKNKPGKQLPRARKIPQEAWFSQPLAGYKATFFIVKAEIACNLSFPRKRKPHTPRHSRENGNRTPRHSRENGNRIPPVIPVKTETAHPVIPAKAGILYDIADLYKKTHLSPSWQPS
jgi:hypothetical protein